MLDPHKTRRGWATPRRQGGREAEAKEPDRALAAESSTTA